MTYNKGLNIREHLGYLSYVKRLSSKHRSLGLVDQLDKQNELP